MESFDKAAGRRLRLARLPAVFLEAPPAPRRWPGHTSLRPLRLRRPPWIAAMKVLLVLLLIASHHSSKQHKLLERDIEQQLQPPAIKFIMPGWCSVPQIEQFRTRCMVYRI
jgi:hypothetical protein